MSVVGLIEWESAEEEAHHVYLVPDGRQTDGFSVLIAEAEFRNAMKRFGYHSFSVQPMWSELRTVVVGQLVQGKDGTAH